MSPCALRTLTSPQTVQTAPDFYKSMGKRPIHIKKEVKGFVANRVQAALWRDAFGMVSAGVATVENIDGAGAHGPGVRWTILGPFVNL